MRKQGEKFQKKQDDKEKNRQTRAKKSGESESPDKQYSDTLLINKTPFLPRIKEHAEVLAKMKFTAQKNNFLQQLHQTYGSRYVQRLLASMNVQAELTVSQPHDIYEQEADRVADVVTRTIDSPVQRVDTTEEEELLQGKSVAQRALPEDEEELQMQPGTDQAAMVSKDIEMHINSARGGGQPLANNIKKPMEQAFGADFGGVRTHTDSEADMLNKQLSARAFTTGQDIFFREGEYSPGSTDGRHLIAHELTHVVQQSGGQVNRDSKALQMDKLTVQREWVPTAGDLAILDSMHPSALGYYKLNDYLKYSGLYNMLEGFARSIDAAENIHFLKDMEEYGPKPEAAENIWHKYLMDDATEPINVSGPTMAALRASYTTARQRAQTAFEHTIGHSGPEWEIRCPVCNELKMGYGHVPGRDMFNDAKKEILLVVETNNILERFRGKAKAYAKG